MATVSIKSNSEQIGYWRQAR